MTKLIKAALLFFLSISTCHSFQQPTVTSKTHLQLHPSSHVATKRSTSIKSDSNRNSLQRRSTRSNYATPITTTTTTTSSRPSSTSLAATSLLTAASSPAGAFLVLTTIIVVHEAGHYLAARSYGIKVEEFSIGFGPKLFGFEALGNEFNFRAFPLGGYVRFPENYNITQYQQQQEEMRERIREQRRNSKNNNNGNNNKPSIVSDDETSKTSTLGYQVFNALTLGAMERKRMKEAEDNIISIVEPEKGGLGNLWWNNMVGSSSSNKNDNDRSNKKNNNKSPATKTSKELIDPGKIPIDFYDDPDLLQNRPWFQRSVVLSGGVVFNLLLAFVIYFGEITTSGLPQPVFDQGVMVSQNPVKDAPANGILRRGDVVVGINGKCYTVLHQAKTFLLLPKTFRRKYVSAHYLLSVVIIVVAKLYHAGNTLALSERPTAAASQKAITDLISTIRATPDGDDLKLSVIRKKASKPVDVTIAPKRAEGNSKGPKTIGVMLSPNFVKMENLKVDNPMDAIVPAARLVSSTTQETANGLLKFFGQLVTGKDTGGQQVSGPIGLLKTGSDVVSTKDWSTVFAFAAAISINLGVVNALPLPALDGGQLVFVLAEAISGRKIDQRLQEEIIGITVLLLLFVSVNAALGDVQNLLK